MKNKFPKNKIDIKRETREKIIGNPSRKISTQEKAVPPLMKMIKVIVIQKRYYLWLVKIKEPPIVMKKNAKSISK
jgi:hypothetical protein